MSVFVSSWESLKGFVCPEWFRDAKLGIWAHWGPQAVPMVGDWYARHMYQQGHPQYEHHVNTFGHPSQFGYKDIIPLWTAERFDPERLMRLYQAAGARYFVSMGVHHDNFDLWNSKHQHWNAVTMGPKRDIVGAWQAAARDCGLKFGVSEHLGASFTWWQGSHRSDKEGALAGVPYDGADPQWESLYHVPAREGDTAWYSTDERWAAHWLARITDLIDSYQPDLLYTDGALPFGEVGRQMLAHFYNSKPEVVYNLKDWTHNPGHGEYVEGIGVQDVERGGLAEIKPSPWQTDTAIGDWYYNKNWKAGDTGTMYRGTPWVVHTLLDVVSKNGNLLLNVIQRPDGALDPEVETLLAELTVWMAVHSPAIHGTRPWRLYGEGPTRTDSGHFKEDFGFSAADIRFTQAKDGSALYATALGWPEDGTLTIRSLAGDAHRVARVELLGHDGALAITPSTEGLRVTLPERPTSTIACTLKLTGEALTL